jgi:hypothetical protein
MQTHVEGQQQKERGEEEINFRETEFLGREREEREGNKEGEAREG